MEKELQDRLQAIISHHSYELAYLDHTYIRREDLRPLRLELELLKPQMLMEEANIQSTVVVFGGTQIVSPEESQQRIDTAQGKLDADADDSQAARDLEVAQQTMANAHFYEECRHFSRMVSEHNKKYKDGELSLIHISEPTRPY